MTARPPVPEISVVIPARNAEATLGVTLDALGRQAPAELAYEVIVVDSASQDGTVALARAAARADPRIVVLENPAGEPASSRNLGVEAARAPIIAFTDADCVPDPGWLSTGLRAMNADTAVGLIQGRVLPARDPGRHDRTLSVGHETGLYETANLFIRRELHGRVGGFTPLPGLSEDRPFGEDTWFAWRLKRTGARSRFEREALVHHAVFARGPGAYVLEQRRRRYFPVLVAAVPELRATFLQRRVFLSGQTARFDLALIGLLGLLAATKMGSARRRRPALALSLCPYLATLPPRPRHAAVQIAADSVGAVSLLGGTLSSRCPVL